MAMLARSSLLPVMLIVGGALLAACSADDPDQAQRRTGGGEMAALPVPDAARGGVTGMPDLPGPGAIGTPDPDPGLQTDDLLATAEGHVEAAGLSHDAGPDNVPGDDATSGPQAFSGEAAAQEAVAVIGEYYAALDRGSFARAYRLWSQDGAASGQSLQQFADSFAGTATRRVEFMTPGRVDADAGSRYIEVPLAIEETGRDGQVYRYAGAYTLRRAADDDPSSGQRAWRISSADLREVRP